MTYLDAFHAWTMGLWLCWDSPGKGPREVVCSLRVLNLGSQLPLCPCAPLGLWRWAVNGLMAPVMGHCLPGLLCGCADEVLSHNPTKSNIDVISLVHDRTLPLPFILSELFLQTENICLVTDSCGKIKSCFRYFLVGLGKSQVCQCRCVLWAI